MTGCGRVAGRDATAGCRRGDLATVLGPLLGDVGDLGPRRDELEDAAVHLPVAKLLGLEAIMAEVPDVQPVAEIIQHHAALAAERADWPGFPDRLDIVEPQLLAPVPGRGLEAELLGRRARGE